MRPKKVLLLVDADPQWLSVWTLVLDTRGYRVLPAASGAEALELLQMCPRLYECGRSVDAIVSELLLPGGMDGNELARRARVVAAGIPVLLYSRSALGDASGANSRLCDVAGTVFLPKALTTAVAMLERVRLLVMRRRGPKKPRQVAAPGPVCELMGRAS